MNRRWNDTINWAAVLVWGGAFSFWVGFIIFIKECVS